MMKNDCIPHTNKSVKWKNKENTLPFFFYTCYPYVPLVEALGTCVLFDEKPPKGKF